MRGALLVVALVLAGCATPSHGTATTNTSLPGTVEGTSHNRTALNQTRLLGHSDTAHLLVAPHTNLTAPRGNETLIATKSPAAGPETFVWNFTVQRAANVTGAHTQAWLRLEQSVAQSGANNDPGCTLALTIVVLRNGTAASYAGGCGSAGVGVLTPGDHLIEFASGPGAFVTRLLPRDNVYVELTLAIELPGLGATAFLVGGSPARDSWVRLDGLHDPAPAPVA